MCVYVCVDVECEEVCQKPRYRRTAVTIRMKDKVREKDPVTSQETKGIRNIDRAAGMVLPLPSSAVVAVAAPGQVPLLYGTNRTSHS
jgi:hypothetical protein